MWDNHYFKLQYSTTLSIDTLVYNTKVAPLSQYDKEPEFTQLSELLFEQSFLI